mgnify:CR=1 FL=1
MNLEKRSRRTIKKKSISKQKHNLKGRKKKEAKQIKQTIKPMQRPWEKIKFILPETTLEIDLLRIDAWKRQIEMINNFSKSNEENSHQDLKLLLAFIIINLINYIDEKTSASKPKTSLFFRKSLNKENFNFSYQIYSKSL